MQIYSCILLVCFIDLVTSAFTKDDVTISCTSQCIKDNVIEGGINDNRTLIFTVKSASFLSISIKFKGIHLMKGSATLAQGPKVAANDSHPYRSRFKIPSKAEFIAAQKAFIFKFTLLKLALQDTGSSFSYTVRYITGEQLPTSGEILISVKGGPVSCGQGLNSSYEVKENERDDASIKFDLCGNPQPAVSARFNGEDVYSVQDSVVVDNYHYSYTPEFKAVRNNCGTYLEFSAKGYDSITYSYSTLINVKFKPDTVEKVYAHWNRADSCTEVSWDKIESGNCSVTYFMKYKKNGTYITIITQELSLKNLCNGQIDNITIVAEVLGQRGDFSVPVIPSTDPPPTRQPTIAPTGKSTGSEPPLNIIIPVVVFVVVLALVGIIVAILCKKKKGKKVTTPVADERIPKYDHVQMQKAPQNGDNEGEYAELNSLGAARKPEPTSQMIYAELGPGGGRTGPRPVAEQSNYAQVKTDVYYPPLQPPNREPPTYATASRTNKPVPPRRQLSSNDYDDLDNSIVV